MNTHYEITEEKFPPLIHTPPYELVHERNRDFSVRLLDKKGYALVAFIPIDKREKEENLTLLITSALKETFSGKNGQSRDGMYAENYRLAVKFGQIDPWKTWDRIKVLYGIPDTYDVPRW